jgi:competence protein ComEA
MKKVNALVPTIGILFLYAIVIVSLIAVMPGVSSAAKKKAAETTAAIVDINTADEKTLEALPGVGKVTAKAIIAGRPYKSVDDLKRVKGMSDKKIQAIKGKISVGGGTSAVSTAAAQQTSAAEKKVTDTSAAASQKVTATEKSVKEKSSKTAAKLAPGQTVNINTATQEQIEALPGIGKVKAQAIIAGRPYEKTEDIMKVKGIKQGIYNKIKDYITVR